MAECKTECKTCGTKFHACQISRSKSFTVTRRWSAGSRLRILLPAPFTATMPDITETLHMNTIFSRRFANGQRLHWTFSKGDENKSVKPFPTLSHHHKVASSVSGRTYSLSIEYDTRLFIDLHCENLPPCTRFT